MQEKAVIINLILHAGIVAILLILIPQTLMAQSGDVPQDSILAVFSEFDDVTEPGCAVNIYRNGMSVYKDSFGAANLDYNIPLSDTSAFYMASVSKHVTAAAAGLLVLRGELDENVLVSDYIEDWPEYASQVRVSHLFNHTSGLPDIYGLMNIAGISLSNVMDAADYLDVIREGEELLFEPGTDFSYTNSGYTTLVYLIETVADTSFAAFADQNLFKPLGMNNTHFHSDRSRIIPNRVISYRPSDDGFVRSYLGNFQGVGPGGLYSTLNDWERWEAFWSGNLNAPDLMSEEEAENLKMWLTTDYFIDDEPLNYGMGLELEIRKGSGVIGHGGSFMGFKTDYRRYPESGFAFLTLCNREDANPENLNNRLADLYLKDAFEQYLMPFEGVYQSEELDVSYRLEVENGRLKLNRRLWPNGYMEQEDEDSWTAGSWEFDFQRDESGSVTGFEVSTGRTRNVEFRKVEE